MPYKDPEKAKAAKRAYYEKNRAEYKRRVKEWKQKCKDYLREAKNQPCTDCGESYPYWVMDFDHLDGDLKLKNVGYFASSGQFGKLVEEIKKCEVVCANCHRGRTHKRRIAAVA